MSLLREVARRGAIRGAWIAKARGDGDGARSTHAWNDNAEARAI